MKKIYLYLITGLILLIIGIEQIGASAQGWHPSLMPWLSFIIFLIGVYFLGKSWDERKKQTTN